MDTASTHPTVHGDGAVQGDGAMQSDGAERGAGIPAKQNAGSAPGSVEGGAGIPAKQSPARVALVGVHGFGAHHLNNLDRLARSGAVDLVAVADPNPPAQGTLPESTAVHTDLKALIESRHSPEIIIVATPIQTHAPLALAALASHADLYLEKPPVASMADFRRLQEAAGAAGRSVQIGFQSLGSHALGAIEQLISSGAIGTLQGIGATGRWVRDRAYYKRSRWAGKRSLDGVDVVDGVATNPLAHAIATALRIAGARTVEDLVSVDTDLYRANDIEADDTSVIRIRTASGLPITCALTLCASESVEPYITLYGTEGSVVFHYTEDRLTVRNSDGERAASYGRDDLTENLLAHLRDGAALISPLDDSGAFMAVLEAIRTAEAPALIGGDHVVWEGAGEAAHAVVRDIENALERAILAHATFSELGLPWARPAGPDSARDILFADVSTSGGDDGGRRTLAVLRSGAGLAKQLSPRPYLHPVKTLAGTTVTDHLPADHSWHLGVGFALQDVNRNNFWGGRTYTREARAYVARPDHGRIEADAEPQEETAEGPQTGTAQPGGLTRRLTWTGADGQTLLAEQRTVSRDVLDERSWRLDFRTELTAVVDLSLGSPGSNGAAGSGYGGFFWRLPACSSPRVFTADADGEPAVHGCVAPWMAWTADFGAGGGSDATGVATLVFAAPPESADPWFVRCAEYPGVGSALAWDAAVPLAAGQSLRRSISVWLCDGALTAAEAAALVEGPPI